MNERKELFLIRFPSGFFVSCFPPRSLWLRRLKEPLVRRHIAHLSNRKTGRDFAEPKLCRRSQGAVEGESAAGCSWNEQRIAPRGLVVTGCANCGGALQSE